MKKRSSKNKKNINKSKENNIVKEKSDKGQTMSRRDFLKITGIITGIAATVSIPIIKMVLNDNKESKEFIDLKEEVSVLLNNFYSESKLCTRKESIRKTEELSLKIHAILKKHGFGIQETGNTQVQLMKFFKSHGYIFAIAPMEVDNEHYFINAPLYKISETYYFDLSDLKFNGFPRCKEKVPISIVEKTYVPDIRETSYLGKKQLILDGLTLDNTKTDESIVLIFPEKVELLAHKHNVDVDKYRKTVEINEVAQVYFSKVIPNSVLGIKLSKLGINQKGKNWKLYHVKEAFSDLASLKYSDAFDYELIRILESDNYSYDYSKTIAYTTTKFVLRKILSEDVSIETDLKNILKSLDHRQYAILKNSIIDSYEANIKLVLSQLLREAQNY